MNMPISLHAITGVGRESQWNFSLEERYMRSTILHHEVERSFSVLIFSGVLDRFPDLKVVSAENSAGWLPFYLQRMDRTFERSRHASGYNTQTQAQRVFPAPDVLHLH